MYDYNQEWELRSTLKNWEIDLKILDLLPGRPVKVFPFAPDCLILETGAGPMALWIYQGQEATIASQNLLLKIFETRRLENFLYPLQLTDERTYAPLDGRRWFYVTAWPDTRRVLFRNHDDIKALVDLLLVFRKTLQDTGAGYLIPDRKEKTHLPNKFQMIIEALESFAILAKHRLRPTRFDHLYRQYYTVAVQQMKQALKILDDSGYQSLIAGMTVQDLVINRLVRNNLRISQQNQAICLRCHDLRQDLPVVDLGTLLVKAGRSLKWDYEWFEQVITRYQEHFPISRNERKVLLGYLTCPWGFYRLAARYYYNRAEWPAGTFVERLERILKVEPKRLELLDNLNFL